MKINFFKRRTTQVSTESLKSQPRHIQSKSQLLNFSKRQKFVLATLFLFISFFTSTYFSGVEHLISGLVLALLTDLILYLILKQDVKSSNFYPMLILPFFFTLSFSLFYLIIPSRMLSKMLLSALFGFGLYSLFLTQNIFAISQLKTINLLRSARIVSFVITLLVLFFISNFVFSLHLPFFISPFVVALVVFFLNFQSLWVYTQNAVQKRELVVFSTLISFCIAQLSFVLLIWPVNASIYSLFLTAIFYTYSGLSHAWFEKRLFRGVLWEYIWVGFLSIFILVAFSKWGI